MINFSGMFFPIFTMLFVVIDPIGNMPVFLSLTTSPREGYREKVALRACLIGFLVLTFFAFAGEKFLTSLGISLPAFRIAGGIMLFIVGIQMIFGEEKKDDKSEETPGTNDVAVFPLAVPLIAGPGTIASIILLMSEQQGHLGTQLLVIITLAAVLLCQYVAFRLAGLLSRLFGQSVNTVISKIFGIILGAMSTQFVIDGIKASIA